MCAKIIASLVLACGVALAQQEAPKEQTEVREALAVSYPDGATVKVELKGTSRLPEASGEARVSRRLGRTEIEAKFKDLRPAVLFGGDINTYVLWLVSPEGIAVNGGEMVLNGDKSELRTSTSLTAFAMFVTAEPHYLVEQPSTLVVLENTEIGLVRGRVITVKTPYRAFAGKYRYNQESLAGAPKTKGEFRADRQQAAIALNFAEQAQASTYAPEELRLARDSMSEMVRAFEQGQDEDRVSLLAHRTVRLAVEAQQAAERGARQAAIEAERRERQEQIARLDRLKTEAEQARREAEQAAAEARQEAARAEKERKAALEAKEEAEAAAQQALIEQRQARELMLRAQQEAAYLKDEKDAAQQEADELRQRMQQALSLVVETRETARGLIVNLPDILFDSGKATLRPRAREVLSRVAGILLVSPAYELSVEGHTDSTGSEELNQQLSERRAQAVRDYLVEAHVSPDLITTRGYGETQPVDTNDTAAGRQRNRRVEIVIQNVDPELLANPE